MNPSHLYEVEDIDCDHAYRNVTRLFDELYFVMEHFHTSKNFYALYKFDNVLHPDSNSASSLTFPNIIAMYLGNMSIFQFLTEDEYKIEQLCRLIAKDLLPAYKELVYWQVKHAYEQMMKLRILFQ